MSNELESCHVYVKEVTSLPGLILRIVDQWVMVWSITS